MKISSPITMTFPGPPRRAVGLMRYILLAAGIIGILFYLRNSAQLAAYNTVHTPTTVTPDHLPYVPIPQNPSKPDIRPIPNAEEKEPVTTPKHPAHPIDNLIKDAEKTYEELLKKETRDLKSAAAEYRRRRGRHPPPGFDQWFKFAQDRDAVMVEDFFDQIYHDLAPFWGVNPKLMRREAHAWEMTINVRDHIAKAGSDWFWTQIWLDLVGTLQEFLPDLDMALNAMDEPRIVAPWEEINKFMERERASRHAPPPKEVVTEFGALGPRPESELKVQGKDWQTKGHYWEIARRGCHPDSLARQVEIVPDHDHTPTISLAHALPHTYQGYVSNYSMSTDFCHQPDLQSLHGMMINPLSISSTKTLFPMFGGSKLPTNNEILLPAPMYWSNEERFSGGDDHGESWVNKLDQVIWRGVATGGKNKPDNWKGFQRHRFVAMTNATKLTAAEKSKDVPQNWAMPSTQYNLAAQQDNRLGEWTGAWADTGFVDLMCAEQEPNGTCNYTSPYYKIAPGMTMAEQFDRKFLPDIDGNSFSGRYRGFLLSTSLPIKATIFREWHDSRLVPWKHFVPMDNRFMDFWGIMEYFVGYEGENTKIEGHDKNAERIAMSGQEWANKVLRPEDMQIYVFRLLLEYARVSDDRRENMGWVADLL